MEIRFEYAWKPYRFLVQSSTDGTSWTTLADHSTNAATGSPVVVASPAKTRLLRLVFPAGNNDSTPPAVLEWAVFP